MNVDFPLEIVRTRRKKTASIQIVGEMVKVMVPNSLSERRVQDLIHKRTTWIKKKLKLQSEKVLPKPKEYVNGENFIYLGQNYRLKIVPDSIESSAGVKIKNGYLQVPVQRDLFGNEIEGCVRDALERWYIDRAFERLLEKTKRYSLQLGVQPQAIEVKDYKSRWGSCSISGEISYNWRIIIAPHRIVDYIVVHELCHLLEHNHSSRYWYHVENAFPLFRECRDWLKANGAGLFI